MDGEHVICLDVNMAAPNIARSPGWNRLAMFLAVSVVSFALSTHETEAQDLPEGFTTVFASPSFKLGETVVGIDGWEPVADTKTRPEMARIEPLLNGSQTGLLLLSYGLDKHLSEKLTGLVRMTAVFNFSNFGSGQLLLKPMFLTSVGYITFGYRGRSNAPDSEPSGFFFEAPTSVENSEMRKECLVKREDLIEGQPYTVTLDVDCDARLFTISVTGKKADSSPLQVKVADISYESQYLAPAMINGIRIISGGGTRPDTRILLESVSLKPLVQ